MCRAQRHNAPIITEEPFKSSCSLDPQLCTTQLICPDSSARPRVRIADELPETSSKWSCNICTFLNWPRAIRCTQCLSQRQQGSQHGPLSPSEAPQTSDSGSRHTPVISDPCEEYNDRNRLNIHAQRWPCSACTYENLPKSLRCVVCDHPKPSGSPEAPQQDSEAESATSPSIVNEQERDNLRTAGGGGWAGAGRGNSLHLRVKGRRRWRSSWLRERWAAITSRRRTLKNSNRSGTGCGEATGSSWMPALVRNEPH